ncbi:hypothetical protein [Paenibacillus chibensis]|uniref:hypothetical protein n=1 Tax=Paenibacillus chibensis TaxID=59846 RepID=UPI000FDB5003|nr:hypothetical protein [Paenibacillus chibensis]MEC0369428.1 hypothetical protein [Paenibacillus chibensis]
MRTGLMIASIISLCLVMGCSSHAKSPVDDSGTAQTSDASDASAQGQEGSTPTSSVDANAEGNITSLFPATALSGSVTIDSIHDKPEIRAETKTESGTLLMISGAREERGHLAVSSTYGQEGDQTFQSDYSIIYRQGNRDQLLLRLPDLIYIQPDDRLLTFRKVSFPEADVYFLTPQYQGAHGTESYAFGVDQASGEAFALTFEDQGQIHHTLVFSSTEPLPTNEQQRLVVYQAVGPGGEPKETPRDVYRLDMDQKRFIKEY